MRRFALVTALFITALSASAATPSVKSYQVTGPVLEMTETTVTVQKGKEKWVIAKDATTKTTGELKVGSKVTIYYSMTAQEIESKGDTAAAGAKKAKKTK